MREYYTIRFGKKEYKNIPIENLRKEINGIIEEIFRPDQEAAKAAETTKKTKKSAQKSAQKSSDQASSDPASGADTL